MRPLTIGKVAKLSGVGVETVRFYEREGLIPDPPRRESGYRQYPEETVSRIRFIKRAKELGFSLKEIKELLFLSSDPSATCGDIRKRAKSKIADIDARIQTLRKMKIALSQLTATCSGIGPTTECPILETLKG